MIVRGGCKTMSHIFFKNSGTSGKRARKSLKRQIVTCPANARDRAGTVQDRF